MCNCFRLNRKNEQTNFTIWNANICSDGQLFSIYTDRLHSLICSFTHSISVFATLIYWFTDSRRCALQLASNVLSFISWRNGKWLK